MELTGNLLKIVSSKTGTSEKTGKEWHQCDFLVSYQAGQNQKQALFSLYGTEKCENLRAIAEGKLIKVTFDIETNEWKDKFYVKLSAWGVSAL